MKNKHRIKQGLSLLLAGGIALTNLGAALPAFADDAAATPETAQTATLDTGRWRIEICTPTCRMHLPAVLHRQRWGFRLRQGETKISLSAVGGPVSWSRTATLTPEALNSRRQNRDRTA